MTRSYSSLLSWLGLTIAASLMLYHTSDRVNELDRQLKALNAQIEAEQQSLHVLKAEWVYLSNPARIEAAAQRHLALLPTAPARVVAMRDMGSLLPMHDGSQPVYAAAETEAPVVAAKPEMRVASLRSDIINAGHINDHMIMQHKIEASSTVMASTDRIGALISSLGMGQ